MSAVLATAGWVALPGTITTATWQSLRQYLAPDLRTLASEGGFRYRISGQTVMVRLAPAPDDLVYLRPLQAANGQFRQDVKEVLVRDTVKIDLSKDLRPRLLAKGAAGELSLDQLGAFQAALFSVEDPFPVLREILAGNP